MVKSYGLGYPVLLTDPVEEIKRDVGTGRLGERKLEKRRSRRVSAEMK